MTSTKYSIPDTIEINGVKYQKVVPTPPKINQKLNKCSGMATLDEDNGYILKMVALDLRQKRGKSIKFNFQNLTDAEEQKLVNLNKGTSFRLPEMFEIMLEGKAYRIFDGNPVDSFDLSDEENIKVVNSVIIIFAQNGLKSGEDIVLMSGTEIELPMGTRLIESTYVDGIKEKPEGTVVATYKNRFCIKTITPITVKVC